MNKGRVQGVQLVEQHSHGPAVRDDMMHDQQQYMVLIAQLDETTADQGTGFQNESGTCLFGGQTRQFSISIAMSAQIVFKQTEGTLLQRCKPLYGLLFHEHKSGTQRLV